MMSPAEALATALARVANGAEADPVPVVSLPETEDVV